MIWLFYILFIVYAIIIISQDFKSSKGFIKQKILHVISLTIIIAVYISSFKILFLINNFSYYYDKILVQQSILPPLMNFITVIIGNILGIILFLSAWLMLKRNHKGRKIMINVLPFSLLISIPSVYDRYLLDLNKFSDTASGTFSIFYSVFAIFVLLCLLGMIFMYNSLFMIDFFDSKTTKTIQENDNEPNQAEN